MPLIIYIKAIGLRLNYAGCRPVACRLVHSFGSGVQICGYVAHPTAFQPKLVVVCFPGL
jgi:hypothetical protein